MVNEFAYCPQLFLYEWVEGLFAESADTIEGSAQHQPVDEKASPLPEPENLAEKIHARSVTLASARLRVIVKMDLVEVEGQAVTPVDYKHGRPREGAEGLERWPSDRAPALQGARPPCTRCLSIESYSLRNRRIQRSKFSFCQSRRRKDWGLRKSSLAALPGSLPPLPATLATHVLTPSCGAVRRRLPTATSMFGLEH